MAQEIIGMPAAGPERILTQEEKDAGQSHTQEENDAGQFRTLEENADAGQTPAPEIDTSQLSSLTLAYIGDAVYELALRTIALEKHAGNPNETNAFAKKYDNAAAQAKIVALLMDELTAEEMAIYKRGRNAKSVSAPKTCSISQYRNATGLEALCGSLYLNHKETRVMELVHAGIEKYEADPQ